MQLGGVASLLAIYASLINLGILPGSEEVAAGQWHAVFRHWRWNEESPASDDLEMAQVSQATQEKSLSSVAAAAVFPLPNVEESGRFLSDTSPVASSQSAGSSSSSSTTGCERSHGIVHSLEGTLAFLMTCFVLCCALEHLNLMVPHFCRLPISVVMFMVGKALGAFCLKALAKVDHHDKGFDVLIQGLQGASWFDPHALLYVILPPLLYESAASMSWRVLRKVLPSAMLLAVPGVLLNTLLTGFYVKGVVRVQGQVPAWETAWLLSSILSATDPVAVVAALHALGAPDKLAALIEGESLLNDGTSVVAVYVLRDWVMGAGAPSSEKFCPGSPPSPTCIGQYFVQVAFGGCLVGLTAGFLLACWVAHVRTHYHTVLEISIILTAVYSTFFVAEAIATSGVLAVVTLGFVVSAHISSRLSHEGRHNHHVILSQISYACNQVAFLAAGIITARFMWGGTGCRGDHTAYHGYAWLELIGLWVTIHLTRAAVIALFLPFLRRLGYGLTWKELAILVYGGLRGAVGLVMSLIVEHSEYIDAHISQMVAFHTSGIVLSTLLINGLSIQYVYRGLDLYPPNPFRRTYLRKVLAKLEVECQKGDIRQIAKDWFFWDVLLAKILRGVPNFKFIQFCEAQAPAPAGILAMPKVLKSVEESANVYMQESIMMDQDGLSFEAPFGGRWDKLKAQREQDFATRFSSLLDECMKITLDRKDHLVRGVIALEDKKLGYRLDPCPGHGLYVSMRSLQTLAEDPLEGTNERISTLGGADEDSDSDEELPSFEFEVETAKITKAVHVIVGLITSPSKIQPPCPQVPDGDEKMILGFNPGTVGLDTHTGDVRRNMLRTASEIIGNTMGPVFESEYQSSHEGSEQRTTQFESECSAVTSQPVAQTTVEEYSVLMEDSCECGNVFMDDAIFCRKCGARRPQKAMYSLEPGTIINISYKPIVGSKEWEVIFTIRDSAGSSLMRKRIPMGRHQPSQLYPAIEFAARSSNSKTEKADKPRSDRASQGASKGFGLKSTLTRSFSAIAHTAPKIRESRQEMLKSINEKSQKKRVTDSGVSTHPSTLNGGGRTSGASVATVATLHSVVPCGSDMGDGPPGVEFIEKSWASEAGSDRGPSSNLGTAWQVRVQAPADREHEALNQGVTYESVGETPVENVMLVDRVESPFYVGEADQTGHSDGDNLQFYTPANQDNRNSIEILPPQTGDTLQGENEELEEVLVCVPKGMPEVATNGKSNGAALRIPGQAHIDKAPISDTLSNNSYHRDSYCSNDTRSSGQSKRTGIDKDNFDDQEHVVSALMLNFELQLATGSDSINELFTVLFNTVRRRYTEMHENGVLGEIAFGWLTESVGEALDCAGREVNSLGAADFKKGNTLATFQAERSEKQSKMTVLSRSMTKVLTRTQSAIRNSTGSERMSEARRKSMKVAAGIGGDAEKNPERRKLAHLFEPMLVEYMSIEKKVSQPSFWDRLPGKWERFRQYGYPVTSAKVEAMWAFVLAHEHVIKECPSLDRYPAMQLCIVRVIEEVKSDLALLEELQPRRFFYAKHLLALRVVMKRRLEKLHRFADEGWLNIADSEALVEHLQERLNQSDHYFPRLHTRALHALALGNKRPSIEASPAWKELEEPGYQIDRPSEASRPSGQRVLGGSARASVKNFFRAGSQDNQGGMFNGINLGIASFSMGLFASRRNSRAGADAAPPPPAVSRASVSTTDDTTISRNVSFERKYLNPPTKSGSSTPMRLSGSTSNSLNGSFGGRRRTSFMSGTIN